MLRPPSIQMVYSSLRDHNKLIRLQDERVAHVVSDMKKLKFIPISWTPDHPQYSSRRVAQPPNIQREEQIYQRKPQVEKLNKLREYLRNIETIPVRRVKPSMNCVYVCVCMCVCVCVCVCVYVYVYVCVYVIECVLSL